MAIVEGRGQLKPERGSTSTSRDSMSNMSETENAVLSGGGGKAAASSLGSSNLQFQLAQQLPVDWWTAIKG